uniref:Uncharacterized protein n=1 Tax=Anguilla anguilla TaxID=7936 RepID=A0A0E9WWL8_ANGAN
MHATPLTYKHQVSADLKRCPRLIYRYDSFEQSARGTAGILLKLAGVGTKIYITNRTQTRRKTSCCTDGIAVWHGLEK